MADREEVLTLLVNYFSINYYENCSFEGHSNTAYGTISCPCYYCYIY